MSDQKNPENGRSNNPDRSERGEGFRREKHAYVGEPLSTVQKVPLPGQVNVPVGKKQRSSHET
jgi:hypothetical protein